MRRRGETRWAGVLWIAVMLGLAACDRALPPTDPVRASEDEPAPLVDPVEIGPYEGKLRIASIFPVYGRFALSGEESHRGVRLAEADAKLAGTIHGREIEVLYYRTGSSPVDVRAAADRAFDAGALAIVGCNASRLSIPLREFAEVRGIPMVSNVSTVPDLTWNSETGQNYEFVFRVCHSDRVMGEFLADCARDDLGASSAAVLYDVSRPYSQGLARVFTEAFLAENDSGELAIETYGFAPLETNFSRQLRAIREFDPDVLFIPGSFTEASLIAVQAEELGVRATLLGGDSWANRLLFRRGAPSRPVYHADHWFSAGPFRERYVEAYGSEPDGGRAALAYDALGAVLHGLENIGRLSDRWLGADLGHTRERLRVAISHAVFEGVTGTIAFDEYGDPSQQGVIVKIDQGVRTLFKDLGDR